MPYRRAYRSKRKVVARSYRRAPVRRYHKKRMTMSKYPVEASKLVRLKYVSAPVTINPAAGLLGIHIFSANDLFKPDVTSAGHQPMGFDEWMTFYEHFTVIGSKITATFSPVGNTTGTNQLVCGIYTDSNTTSTSTPSAMMEQPGTIYKFLGTSESQPFCRVSKLFSTKKFFGQSKVIDNPSLEGSDIASPAELAYFHVFTGASDSTSDPPAIVVNIQINFIAKLTERRTLLSS